MLVFYSKHNVSGWKSSPCKVDSTTCAFLSVIIYRIPKIKRFMTNLWKKKDIISSRPHDMSHVVKYFTICRWIILLTNTWLIYHALKIYQFPFMIFCCRDKYATVDQTGAFHVVGDKKTWKAIRTHPRCLPSQFYMDLTSILLIF